jgi:uncharacterized protein (DUF1015 family)
MAKIRPFKAVIYNKESIKDYSKVVCPPYDVISPLQQEQYHEKDPYNFIRILLGRDIPGEDKYRRAGAIFKDWVKAGVMTQEELPAIYFYSQQFSLKGEKRERFGFICLLRLGEKDSPVFAHENTRLAAKQDRFKLIKQVKANLSPIFVVFQDKLRVIRRVYQKIQDKPPFIDITDQDKTRHRLWRVNDPSILAFVQSGMEKENIFIADGHHRYEVAGAYRDLIKEKLQGAFTGEEDVNYLLTYFTNPDPKGLVILPIHRLLKLGDDFNLKSFISGLKEYFDLEEIRDKTRFFFLMQKGGRSEHVLGMYKDKTYRLLRLKNVKILDKMMADKPKEYRTLDVSVLNSIVFNKLLGYDPEEKGRLTYGHEAEEFIKAVDEDPQTVAFFLNPVRIEQIIAVALTGNKMPPKSTFFYPKVLSGLVINKLDI